MSDSLSQDFLHGVVDGADLLDGGLPGQLVLDVATHGPNRAGSLDLQEGLQQVVGVFGQVFVDWVLQGPASGFAVAGWCVGFGGFVGGEFFLESEDNGPHVPGVEAGNDGLGSPGDFSCEKRKSGIDLTFSG